MKQIKTFEKFKEVYQIDPDKEVVIKDEYTDKINKEKNGSFKGKAGHMEYSKDDDFFSIIRFDNTTFQIPTYMLIHKDKYDINKAVGKFNL